MAQCNVVTLSKKVQSRHHDFNIRLSESLEQSFDLFIFPSCSYNVLFNKEIAPKMISNEGKLNNDEYLSDCLPDVFPKLFCVFSFK